MSTVSSLTGSSSASSFTNFHRGAWCTPPHLFLEDQFDVVPPETASVSSTGKEVGERTAKEVSKAASEARKKSKILQPVTWQDTPFRLEPDHNSGSSGGTSALAPLQLEARSAFQTSQAVSSSVGIVASSPEISLDSPDIHSFCVSSMQAEEARRLTGMSAAGAATLMGIPLSRSTSDGHDASGGEDSDRVPTRIVQRSTNWNDLVFCIDRDKRAFEPKSSSSMVHNRKL
ncbi:hypothetical protein TanjilG_24172 [Lupinus angustifolius]|uniref:Uncharacterized protein n=1 Tax=Lupinus angustifolius TaxID=3871 RepID=A0A1J7IDM9_LUPAN|nr:hypothetical protein TanjilG_24172 [Lupinus angustifolius]